LIHGDYRLDNLLFRPEGATVLLDWQALAWGRAGWEVAYFITTALEPHHKKEEELMLKQYHKVLVESGVADYDYSDLLKDVATSKIMLAHRMVAADDLLDTAKDNGEIALVDLLVTRVVGWIDPG
jgi:aminoglycoside phosphotransferase (APT) family kinase protein